MFRISLRVFILSADLHVHMEVTIESSYLILESVNYLRHNKNAVNKLSVSIHNMRTLKNRVSIKVLLSASLSHYLS